jgi:integrase
MPSNPEKPTTELKTAWLTIRAAAKVDIRWHDLRHTACTKMGQAGVPEETMKAIMGHMSASMIARYSHIRMEAKRAAMDSLCLSKPRKADENQNGVPTKVATVGDTATRQ